jgi:hypothetical protein
MTKKQWLQKKVLVDEWGRPPSLADVPLMPMTIEQAYKKQGCTNKEINQLYKESKNG